MLRTFAIPAVFFAVLALMGGQIQAAQDSHTHDSPTPHPNANNIQSVSDAYPLKIDPLGDSLVEVDHPILVIHDKREIRFASEDNAKKFKADPEKYLPAVDRQMIEQQMAYYPLDVCLVTGEKLGSMGEPTNRLYRNRLVRFCCAGCVDGFEKNAAKHLAKLDAAVIEKQKEHYPTDTCIVSGDKLGGDMGEPVNYVVGNRLIRLCCKGCVRDFIKSPATYLAKLDAAVNLKNEADQGQEHHERKDGRAHGDGHAGHRH